MSQTVIAYFEDRSQADQAVAGLLRQGLITGGAAQIVDYASMDGGEPFGERVSRFFHTLFGTESDFDAEGLRRGDVLVKVEGEEENHDRIVDALSLSGAMDVERRARFLRETGFSSFDRTTATPYTSDQTEKDRMAYRQWDQGLGNDEAAVLPVIEEELKVGKREVSRGGVRVVSRVSTRPVHEEIQLREERVEVERRPVDRPVGSADMDAFKEGEIEMTETSEEAVVSKQARVIEEVSVKKHSSERTERIDDTVRRKDVEVKPIETDRERSSPNH